MKQKISSSFSIVFILVCFLLLTPLISRATEENVAGLDSSGLIPGVIWFSPNSFIEGDVIKIYTLVFNAMENNLSGTVQFYDKDTLLGERGFMVSSNKSKDLSLEWKATLGEHLFYAKIINTEIMEKDGTVSSIFLKNQETKKEKEFITKDLTNDISQSNISNNQDISEGTVESFLRKNTPNFILVPVENFFRIIETWRQKNSDSLFKKIEKIKSESISEGNNGKPTRQIEIFFYNFIFYILSKKLIFYLVTSFLLFIILRFIWKKIFPPKY